MSNSGGYIVLEGAEGVGKTTIADMIVRHLKQLGFPARKMHEPDGQSDATTQMIRRLTQDPAYPMNTKTEVLLYNAARSQSLEVVRAARDAGEIVVVDRSFLTTLAVQFYGRGDINNYQRLNDIIDFAVGDMWPDLTIVLDAPVDILLTRAKKRGERERFDNLDSATLERIRAGYLWEARQRNLPIVYATAEPDKVFAEVWRQISDFLKLGENSISGPKSVAELLTKTPTAISLVSRESVPSNERIESYHVPVTLPDDIQCDFCDEMDGLLSARKKLVQKMSAHLKDDGRTPEEALKSALKVLRPLLPLATQKDKVERILNCVEKLELSTEVTEQLPRGSAAPTSSGELISSSPRNELDLLPAMLYPTLGMSRRELTELVAEWPYELKSAVFLQYLQQHKAGRALAETRFDLDLLTAFTEILDMPEELRRLLMVQTLSPRYGYDMPVEIETAGLSDDYDAVFDRSLLLQNTLQASGFVAESQYATLLGHKQRWSISLSWLELQKIPKIIARTNVGHTIAERYPLLTGVLQSP